MSELIVMRLADMWKRHPDQNNSRVCNRCGAPVGIYPSGQLALKENPELLIICIQCISIKNINEEVEIIPAAVDMEALHREITESFVFEAKNRHNPIFKKFNELLIKICGRRL